MERRGSGLKKIKDDFVNAFNYTEDKSVEFFSDFNEFKVIMKNLNYNYIEKKKVKKSVSKTETKKRKNLEIQIKQIIEFVEKNNEITRIELENMLNIKESRARELLRYSVENNILEKLGKTRNIKYVKK